MRLIFATNNNHKIKEIKSILGEKYKNNIFSLIDFNSKINVEENGNSFIENANIKSYGVYEKLFELKLLLKNDFIISDDSGLLVDYLDGAPGIYSARFMGEETSQNDKNLKIIELLKNCKPNERKASFITVLSVIKIDDIYNKLPFNSINFTNFEGKIDGYIINCIKNSGGFGYDPIFGIGDYKNIDTINEKTCASIGENEKCRISHRFLALSKFTEYLEKIHNI